MNARSGGRSGYSSNLTGSPLSIQDGSGFLADTPAGGTGSASGGSATSVSNGTRDAVEKKRLHSQYSGISYDSSRLNSAPDSLAEDWDLEDGGLEQVNVVVRVRPLSDAEKKRGDKDCVKIQHNSSSITLGNAEKVKTFTFNSVFDRATTQSEVLEKCGIKQMIEMAVDGYSCTTFAYGQTGSGKTYTITGPITQDSPMPPQSKYGLIQRSFIHLFEVLRQRSSPNITFTLSASYLEIYNEQVKDLLNPSGRDSLPVRWSKAKGFYVENLFVVDCETIDDLIAVLEEGMSQRQIATTNINEYSSRSHTIVSLQIDSEMPDPEEESLYITKHGRLSFVDLAGSEKVKELGNTGELLTETTNINKSLLTLGNCISALSDNRKRSSHIPYRDSKLTKLLADSLGGNGITLMVACITPSQYCLSESLSTLRYANRAKRIKNKPVIRMDPREKLILSLKREVRLLRNENVYLRQCLEFPRASQPAALRRNDTEESLPVLITSLSQDSVAGDKTPVPGDFDRARAVQSEAKGTVERRDTNGSSSSQPAFTPKSAADTSLYEMLQEYMVENEKLRSENSDLHNVRERAMTEHQHLSKENDKLLTKLDDLERVFAASPISMNRTVSGSSSLNASARRQRSASQPRTEGSPAAAANAVPAGRAGSQGSLLLQSPDWQQQQQASPQGASKAASGGSGGRGREHRSDSLDNSGSLDQMGQLPPVDSIRGVPNGYREAPKQHPHHAPLAHQQSSPPNPQYRGQPPQHHQPQSQHSPVATHQSFPGSYRPADGSDGGERQGREQHSYPPTQRGSQHHNEPGSAPDTSLSFPPARPYHSQSSHINSSVHSLAGESSPRGGQQQQQARPWPEAQAGPHAVPGSQDPTHSGRPQHKVDIYIPPIGGASSKDPYPADHRPNREPVGYSGQPPPSLPHPAQEKPAKSSPRRPQGKQLQGKQAQGKPAQGKPAGVPASQAPAGGGYSNRNKKNAWGQQGKATEAKTSPKGQHKNDAADAEPAGSEQSLDSIPHTPAATPPPVKYKPKGTGHLLAGTSKELIKPSPDQESLQEINEKLRQELMDLDGEIQYMKYVNKSKGGNPPAPAAATAAAAAGQTKPTKGKRR